MPNTGSDHITRRMALSHAEFLRSLPAATLGMERRVDGARILVLDPPRQIEIQLGPEESRSLGSLVLPQTRVDLRFDGFDADQLQAFLKRFDLAYQRGGG